CPNIEPHENTSNDDVKSKAIQLYSHVQPVQFNKLRCNTNLNLPPSNWLTSSSPISYNLHQALYNSPGFASVISMMVHRVGNTLLIDEFDIQKYLLRKYDEDWKWLRKFIIDNIIKSIGDNERKFYSIKDKSREALQSKNLLSKRKMLKKNARAI
uniref:EDRF1 N-terminal domain-containing protein n=1 Tax=Megaselia scalaris TaxID=36166 RepID=T1GV09_MEGSC